MPFLVLGLGLLTANFLDAFSAVFHNPRAFDGLRSTFTDALLGLLVLSALVACCNCWLLWRFEHGDDKLV